MKVRTRKIIREACLKYPDCKGQLKAWTKEFEKGTFNSPSEILDLYSKASFVEDKVIFRLKGNHYRLIIRINYEHQAVRVLGLFTHKDYDKLIVENL